MGLFGKLFSSDSQFGARIGSQNIARRSDIAVELNAPDVVNFQDAAANARVTITNNGATPCDVREVNLKFVDAAVKDSLTAEGSYAKPSSYVLLSQAFQINPGETRTFDGALPVNLASALGAAIPNETVAKTVSTIANIASMFGANQTAAKTQLLVAEVQLVQDNAVAVIRAEQDLTINDPNTTTL